VTTLTMPLPLIAPHPGRHARPGAVPRAAAVTRASMSAVATAGLLAGGWLIAAHPQPQHVQPHCVTWHSCPCRYPGAPLRLNGNQLCTAQHRSTAPIVAGNDPGR
jgi:hypothetical protein